MSKNTKELPDGQLLCDNLLESFQAVGLNSFGQNRNSFVLSPGLGSAIQEPTSQKNS